MKRIRITKHSGEVFENPNLIYFVDTNIQNQTPKTICNAFKLHCTENHIFLFQTSWKDGLSKKIALEYELSCITGKDDLCFSQKYDLTSWAENERRSFSKNYTEIWYFLQTLKDGLLKRAATGHDLSCIIWRKDGIFSPKTWYFFLGQEVRDDFSEEIHGNMIFSVYTYGCYKRSVTPHWQKISKIVLSRKNTPKDDWRSRLIS